MLWVIVIPVGRVLLLCQPVAKRGISNQVFVKRLEKASPFQAQRFGDLLLEGLTERSPRNTCKRKFGQGYAAAGIHMLLAVRANSSELRCDTFAA